MAPLYRHGIRTMNRVALTFDDGPTVSTPPILEALGSFGAPATFFVVGEWARDHSAEVRAVVDSGHEIACHGARHVRPPNPVRAWAELRWARGAIEQASGRAPRAYRPPWGAVRAGLTTAARAAGMATVLWDVDSYDWRNPHPLEVSAEVTANARAGSIVLLHDGDQPRDATVEAIPGILEGLRRANLELVTVSELLDLD